MHYIKSRIDICEAAKKRLAEVTIVLEEAQKALDPILQSYNISTPEGVVDRLLEAGEKGKLNIDEDLVKLIDILTRYERAKGAQTQFRLISNHIATFSENQTPIHQDLPVEWNFIKLDEGDLAYLFEPYETIPSSSNYRYRSNDPIRAKAAILREARGTHAGQLEQLIRKVEPKLGMSTALRG